MDLAKVVQEQFEELEASGKIKESINTQLMMAIDQAIHRVISYNSDFRKNIELAVKEAIKIDLKQLNIAEYNHTILQMVRDVLNAQLTTIGFEKMKADMTKLLSGDFPKQMKLSELIERAIGELDEKPGEISFFCDEPGYPSSSYWVHFDDEYGKSKYKCKYSLLINNSGTIAIARAEDLQLQEHKFMGGLYGIEAFLFRIYAAGTIIEKDPESVRTEWYEGDD